MAIYHKHLQYHEDTVSKKPLTEDDIRFLKELQKELNTQDTCSTADPRFWVIKGSETVHDYENPQDFELIYEGYGTVAEGREDVCRYLNEQIFPVIIVPDKDDLKIENDSGFYDFILRYRTDEEEEHEYLSADELNEFLEENYHGLEIIGISTRGIIYPSTMFLTQKDAEEHLKANHYHYSDDAHTYAMVAYRSPRIERLLRILQETDWR